MADPPKPNPNWHSKKNKTSGQHTGTGVTQQATGAKQNSSSVETELMWQIQELKQQVAKLTQKQAINSANGSNLGNAGYGGN